MRLADTQETAPASAIFVKEGYNARLSRVYPSLGNQTPAVTGDGGPLNTTKLPNGKSVPLTASDYWVNPNRYTQWLNVANKASVDPRVAYIGGILTDGSFQLIDSGIATTGFTTNDQAGDITVRLVDVQGNSLSSVTLNSQLPILHDQTYGSAWQELSTTSIPIVGLQSSYQIANGQLTRAQVLGDILSIQNSLGK